MKPATHLTEMQRLESKIRALRNEVAVLRDEHMTALAQLAECNLRIAFTMRHFKMQRQAVNTGIVDGVTGKPVVQQDNTIYSLEDVFKMTREQFLAQLIAESEQEQARAQAAAAAEAASQTAGSAAETTEGGDAQPADKTRTGTGEPIH